MVYIYIIQQMIGYIKFHYVYMYIYTSFYTCIYIYTWVKLVPHGLPVFSKFSRLMTWRSRVRRANFGKPWREFAMACQGRIKHLSIYHMMYYIYDIWIIGYIYIYMDVYIYIYIWRCVYIYICIHMEVYIYIYMEVCIYVYIYIYVHVYIYRDSYATYQYNHQCIICATVKLHG